MQPVAVSVVRDSVGRVLVYVDTRLVWPRRDWMISAPCRGLDPAMFVPPAEDYHTKKAPDVVTELCPSCPVRTDCETYGRVTRSTGWFGGVLLYTPGVRSRASKARKLGLQQWQRQLRAEDVRSIRERYAAGGVTQRELAQEYGVSRVLITRTINNT